MFKNKPENKETMTKMQKPAAAAAPARKQPATPWIGNDLILQPFSMMRRMAEDMESLMTGFTMSDPLRVFERELAPFEFAPAALWTPQIEILTRRKKLIVRAELPGIDPNDITIDVADDWLTIQGERRYEAEHNDEGLFRSERSYGTFYRRVMLPEGVNAENATAKFDHGVLEIAMDAPAAAKEPKRIEIKSTDKAIAAKAGK